MSEPLPILISDHDDIPIYLQIAHQVTYLIYSRQLPDGARLPTTRALATQLAVNPNTVTQAYLELQKDGLVEAHRGRGTFVRADVGGLHEDRALRYELLRTELERTRRRARALGFGDAELRRQLFGLLQASPQTCEAAFVAPGRSAAKYARALTAALEAAQVTVTPLPLEDVQHDAAAARDVLEHVYYVITPVSLRGQLEDLLAFQPSPHAVLPITLDLTESAARRVAELPSDRSLCVFTTQRYLAIALNILHAYGTSPHGTLVRVLDTSPEAMIREAFARADVVVHTFGVAEALDRFGVPEDKRLELEFHASDDSVARLLEHFTVGSSAQPEVR